MCRSIGAGQPANGEGRTDRCIRGAIPTISVRGRAVPLPPDSQPSAGTDGALVVWQPSTRSSLILETSTWHRRLACVLGCAMAATFRPIPAYMARMPGREQRAGGGRRHPSMSIAGGLITFEDLERGEINHALAISTPNIRSGVYASPAQRCDGKSTSPLSLPEGAHLRLDPSLNLRLFTSQG